MNSKKYKDVLYEVREITDLRDMIRSSAELFSDDPAFLVKEVRQENMYRSRIVPLSRISTAWERILPRWG